MTWQRSKSIELQYKERKELNNKYENRMGTANSLFDEF